MPGELSSQPGSPQLFSSNARFPSTCQESGQQSGEEWGGLEQRSAPSRVLVPPFPQL